MNRIFWFFLPKSKKLEILIDTCINNKQALWIKTKKHKIRLNFETSKIEIHDKEVK